MNAVDANTAIITSRPVAFTVYAVTRASRRFFAPCSRTRSSTPRCQSRISRCVRAGRSAPGRASASVASGAPAGFARQAVAARSAASAAFAWISAETPGGQRCAQIAARCGSAGHSGHDGVAQLADPRLQGAHEVTRTHELLPTG